MEVNPSWAKGYSRKGTALFRLRRHAAAAAAYSKGAVAVERVGRVGGKDGRSKGKTMHWRYQVKTVSHNAGLCLYVILGVLFSSDVAVQHAGHHVPHQTF